MKIKEIITENSWKERYSNPYEVLGIDSTATVDEVKQAYRKMSNKWHPDKFSDSADKQSATQMMGYINTAKQSIDTGDIRGTGPAKQSRSNTDNFDGPWAQRQLSEAYKDGFNIGRLTFQYEYHGRELPSYHNKERDLEWLNSRHVKLGQMYEKGFKYGYAIGRKEYEITKAQSDWDKENTLLKRTKNFVTGKKTPPRPT